jgi:peptidase M23-like protein
VSLGPGAAKPTVYYQGRRVLVARDAADSHWSAVVGIPLSAIPGTHTLRVRDAGSQQKTVRFEVQDKRYPEQHITLKDERKVNPTPEDLHRIRREQAQLAAASRSNRAKRYYRDK